MRYLAKITAIAQWVNEHFDKEEYPRRKDAKDIYIEVSNIDMADNIEELNRLYEKSERLRNKILDTLEDIQ